MHRYHFTNIALVSHLAFVVPTSASTTAHVETNAVLIPRGRDALEKGLSLEIDKRYKNDLDNYIKDAPRFVHYMVVDVPRMFK